MQTTSAHPGRRSSDQSHFPISLGDLAQALDHSDEGFALTDPDGNYAYINAAHLRMYGYERPQDLLGRSWRLLYTPEWVRHFEEAVLPVLPRDKVWRGQVISRRQDGSSFLVSVTLTLLPDGKITCNCRDESARPQEPEATAKPDRSTLNELGERLIATLPARFRRPLDMVNGYSSFLLAELAAGRRPPGDSLREGLVEIDAAGRRLAEQMRRLDLVAELAARAEFGNDANRVPGPGWSNRVATACRQSAEAAQRPADLTIDFSAGRPALDERALECVLLELLANALQSSRPGDAIHIGGQTVHNSYTFKVCDDGVGLPPEGLAPSTGQVLGQESPSGFGLAVVQYILRQARGRLELDHDAPSSTCLRVTVPLA